MALPSYQSPIVLNCGVCQVSWMGLFGVDACWSCESLDHVETGTVRMAAKQIERPTNRG